MGEIKIDSETMAAIISQAKKASLTLAETAARAVVTLCGVDTGGAHWRDLVIGAYAALLRSERREPVARMFDYTSVPDLHVDDATHALVRFAAQIAGVSEAEVIARAVRLFSEREADNAPPDPWVPVDVYGEYEGHRVEGQYLPATRRLTVTTEPVKGTAHRTPSGAARAVVAALNPNRANTQTNGWRFWHITGTGERLEAIRPR